MDVDREKETPASDGGFGGNGFTRRHGATGDDTERHGWFVTFRAVVYVERVTADR
jgi:hypothetical protein